MSKSRGDVDRYQSVDDTFVQLFCIRTTSLIASVDAETSGEEHAFPGKTAIVAGAKPGTVSTVNTRIFMQKVLIPNEEKKRTSRGGF
jgi:hypothetical protein